MYKQLAKQVLRNKVFVSLLFLLTVLTSLSFFFVRFSIDGNKVAMEVLPILEENQVLYRTALNSNSDLAYMFLASMTCLTAFVFVMFFYRSFRTNRKQIGCLKSLGFKDRSLCDFFITFTALIAISGALPGMVGGYFLSNVLINANIHSYGVSGLVRTVMPVSMAIGLGAAAVLFCVVTFFCYGFIRGKEAGTLTAGIGNKRSYSVALRIASAVSGIIPIRNKFPLRIVLRKPLAVLLIIAAVMSFSVCMMLGQSLLISRPDSVSNKVSANINQAIGGVVGCILIFLALYVNFQDSTRDMMILRLMGYLMKDICKMLVNVYQPIVCAAFLVTLAPGILLAKNIFYSLSLMAGDDMPFRTNIWVVLLAFVTLNIIYLLVQVAF
jgi:predicted lysophospholipase L1 biosynthesis ABC-type transport system permease subunit